MYTELDNVLQNLGGVLLQTSLDIHYTPHNKRIYYRSMATIL